MGKTIFINLIFMDYLNEMIINIELHSVKGIEECFANGISPNDQFRGAPLIYELTSEYTRSQRFKDCVKTFVDNGLEFDDKILLATLLDDAGSLTQHINNDPATISKKYTLRCAYTPLYEATLLHICAEFNHVSCAEVLLKHGADVNTTAGVDENGFGGQTPIFHTVNQNSNNSAEMMELLLSHNADLALTVRGLIWGKGYDWETLVPSINPVSYAMMGLLPQMHRNEMIISDVVTTLLKQRYGINYTPKNVPCAYLKK
ncbi:MAG: ankyrin repeat domain-containing protein [Chitinophagaceae bacterium]